MSRPLPFVIPSEGTKLRSTEFKTDLTLRGQKQSLCWLRRFLQSAIMNSLADLVAARRPTKPLSHQPVLYRQHLQEKEVLRWTRPTSCVTERVYGWGKRGGYQAQQATLTRPCTQSPHEPFSCCPLTPRVTWSLRPPLNYYHNFPERHCRASGPQRHPCFTECFVFYCL